MKTRSLLIFCCFVSTLSAIAQDYTVLPGYLLRSQLFMESGFARPHSSSWINKSDHFVFHSTNPTYFQLAYDRTFLRRPWHLRASIYRANTDVYWSLADHLLIGFPAVGDEPEPKEVGLRVQQGVTETAIGLGYRLNPFKSIFVKSTISLGMVSKGTSSFTPEYHYKGTNGDTIEVIISSTKPEKQGDLGMMAKLDVELGYAINDVHSFGICAAFAQYGFSNKPSGLMTESNTAFEVESENYSLQTALRTRTFSYGLRYSFSFNLK